MPDETLSPETIRELAALDAALAGEPVERDLADLAELTALLREERPQPDPQFIRALDHRAAQRFPRGVTGARGVPAAHGAAKLRRRLSGTLRSPAFRGLVATACVLGIVAVVVASGDHSSDDSAGSSGASVAAPAEKQSESARARGG